MRTISKSSATSCCRRSEQGHRGRWHHVHQRAAQHRGGYPFDSTAIALVKWLSAMFTALEFFAGSGLVRLGLAPEFETLWANDNCPKKRAVYVANHPWEKFHLADIQDVRGRDLPAADLAWASFPCQDLSLAGNLNGMNTGTRSGLFWDWIRVLKELGEHGKRPPVLVAENVVGFVVADQGKHFRQAYGALRDLGYRVGAVVIDANAFVPQSRPRAFMIAVAQDIPLDGLSQQFPSEPFHPTGLVRTSFVVDDPGWVWWSLPFPKGKRPVFSDLCERDAPCDPPSKTRELCAMLSSLNKKKLDAARQVKMFFAGTAYRRTRPDEGGNKVQRLEIRFDGIAGCLRTPNGGSSRQTVILVDQGLVRSRLMTVRECARLMGAPDTYQLQGSYNDGYRAMGDAVAVPVTRWLTYHLLTPLTARSRSVLRPESTFEECRITEWGSGEAAGTASCLSRDFDV
jgi:DNA (cytosine-5)-methyltransferase 1